MSLKIGTRVSRSKMWKFEDIEGVVIKKTKDYTVVKWDGVNGEWHYTEQQATTLKVIQDKKVEENDEK